MRIAVNTRLLIPNKMDGIARFSYETLIRICKQNPTVEFTFIFDRKPSAEFNFPQNVTLVSLSPPARHPILWFWYFEFSLKKYLNRNNFDLFLSPEGWIPPALKCRSLAVIHDLNFAHHPENIVFSHRTFLNYFFPKYAKRADRIATVSEFSKSDIHATYNIPLSEIDVVYNGANEIFKPINENKKANIRRKFTNEQAFFIFIGTIHPRKNLEHLFLGFEEFCQTNKTIQLLIVGNKKWWPSSLEQLYQNLNCKNRIQFLGRLEDEELAELLSSAEALTYLPYFEGFGIPILEAFQSEVPVITSDVTSMPEVSAGAALLCNPKNTSEIARSMNLLTSDQNMKKSLIQKGKSRAKDFNWAKSSQLLWESMLKTMAE